MNKECQYCLLLKCTHCRCTGFTGCNHKSGELCPNNRYKNRTCCNTCARKKFDYKHLIEPVEQYVNQLQMNAENDVNSIQGTVHQFVDIDRMNNNFNQNLFSSIESPEWNAMPEQFPPPFLSEPNSSGHPSSLHTIFSYNFPDSFDSFYHNNNRISSGYNKDIKPGQDYLHINLEYNISPIFIIPYYKTYTISTIRTYLSHHFDGFNIFPYKFISSLGTSIFEQQENEILINSIIIPHEYYDPIRKSTIIRKYVFIRMIEYESNISNESSQRKRMAFNNNINIEEIFLKAPIQDQERLALNVYSSFHYNIRDSYDGRPLLIRAAYHNLPRAVNMILLSGGDINVEDRDGNTALHICSKLGHYEVLSLLLDKLYTKRPCICGRPDLFHRNKSGLIPIQVCDTKNYKCFSLLRDTISRFRRINPSVLILQNITRLSDIRDALNRDSVNDSLLSDMSFVYEGTFVCNNQEDEISASSIQFSGGFVVFIPPTVTNTFLSVTESVSSLSLMSYNKNISFNGSYTLPNIHQDILALRTIVDQDNDQNIRDKLESLMESNRNQFNSLNVKE